MIGARAIAGGLLLGAAVCASSTEGVAVDYMTNCQGCHLPDGSGAASRGVPSLRAHMGRLLTVDGGREFLVRVPGAAMSDLDDARLAAVLNWMLTQFDPEGLPHDFAPYEADEVAALRAAPLINVKSTRAALLRSIEAARSDVEGARP